MNRDSPDTARNRQTRLRPILHMVMGLLYLVLGVSVIAMQAFGTFELDPGIAYVMGTVLCLYGVFRLWRGYTEFRQ